MKRGELDSGAGAFADLEQTEAAQLTRCIRVLLRRPLLRAGGPDGGVLPVVRRYRSRLQTFFSAYCGYRLVVESTFARLYKTGPGLDGTRGASASTTGAPFTPRAYAYLALTLAVLTGSGPQVLLSGLVADIRSAAAEAELPTPDDITGRRALVAALRHLVALGVLTETDGSLAPWVEDTTAEALISIDVELLRHLVAAPLRQASDARSLLELAADPGPGGARHAVRRRIIEDPVVHVADLSTEQVSWLRSAHRGEARLLEERLGLRLELRAEGAAAVDDEDYLTDLHFPGTSTLARCCVLVLPDLLEDPETRRADGWYTVTPARLRRACAELVERFPDAWSKDARDDPDALADQVAHRLREVGLAQPGGDDLVLLSPAAHRYTPVPDDSPRELRAQERQEPAAGEAQPAVLALFDDSEGAAVGAGPGPDPADAPAASAVGGEDGPVNGDEGAG